MIPTNYEELIISKWQGTADNLVALKLGVSFTQTFARLNAQGIGLEVSAIELFLKDYYLKFYSHNAWGLRGRDNFVEEKLSVRSRIRTTLICSYGYKIYGK